MEYKWLKPRPHPEGMPTSGMVETTNPDGSWERTYYGKDVPAALGELRETSDREVENRTAIPQHPIRFKNGKKDTFYEDACEKFERDGQLGPLRNVHISGVSWGGKKKGCDVCGRSAGGLRLVGDQFLCKKRCLGVTHGLATNQSGDTDSNTKAAL